MEEFILNKVVLSETIVEGVLKQAHFDYREEPLEQAIDQSLKNRNKRDFLRLYSRIINAQMEQSVMEKITYKRNEK